MTTLEIINETIAELKTAATTTEKFTEALQGSIKALEMVKGLDAETKALAITEYQKVLKEVSPISRIDAELSAYEEELCKMSKADLMYKTCYRFKSSKERLIAALLREKRAELGK